MANNTTNGELNILLYEKCIQVANRKIIKVYYSIKHPM